MLYALIALGELVGEKFFVPPAGVHILVFIFKPLLMPILLAWMLTQGSAVRSGFHRLIMISLVFSTAGDCFLMFKNDDLFIFGLGSFLVAHVLYIVAFARNLKGAAVPIPIGGKIMLALPFAGFVGIFLYILKDHILGNETTKDLLVPVAVYATVIGTMGLFAMYRMSATNRLSFRFILAGALLFIASDSLIAINKFVSPLENASLMIMITYILAQYFIVKGALCHTSPQPK